VGVGITNFVLIQERCWLFTAVCRSKGFLR